MAEAPPPGHHGGGGASSDNGAPADVAAASTSAAAVTPAPDPETERAMLVAQLETLQQAYSTIETTFGEYRQQTRHAMIAIGAELSNRHPELAGVVNAVLAAPEAGGGSTEGGASADGAPTHGAPARATLMHLTAVASEAREVDDRSDGSCGHGSDERQRSGSDEGGSEHGSERGSDRGSDHSGSNGHSEGGASHGSGASGGAISHASSSNATSSSCEPRSEISGSSGPTSNSISS